MRTLLLLFATIALVACSGPDSDRPDDSPAEEPPFFTVDENATGPLTLAELQIDIPSDVERWMSKDKKACFMNAVERRAQEAGDPASLDPNDFPYWGGNVDQEEWSGHTRHIQRVLLAQAVVSWAMMDC